MKKVGGDFVSMPIKDLIKPIVRVPYSLNIASVAVTMTLNKIQCVLVDHFDGSLGIITEKDIIREVVARCRDASLVRAWEIMKQPVITADEEIDMHDAIEIMRQCKIRNLVITRGEEILGVVKRSTILNNIKFEEEDYWTAGKENLIQKEQSIH